MKKLILSVSVIFAIFANSVFAYAGTIYIPSAESSQYLPTVQIISYSLSYDGSLLADGAGSGTLIDSKGTIVTNAHVIRSSSDSTLPADAFQVCLTRSNAPDSPVCEFVAGLVAMHENQDIALLRMDSMSAGGNNIGFDFHLPYQNSGDPVINDALTIIGYPDVGGKTITYTTGIVSGFVDDVSFIAGGGTARYMKTDAAISHGNSGGTAVDKDGNFVGIPTVGNSTGMGFIGGLLPVKDFVGWINSKIGMSVLGDSNVKAKLFAAEKAYVSANATGTFKNSDPSYEISVVNGWKFSNSLEEVFYDTTNVIGGSFGTDSVVIVPKDASLASTGKVEIFLSGFAYTLGMDDLEYWLNSFDNSEMQIERTKFNGKYDSYKTVLPIYEAGVLLNSVNYYIPYGNKVLTVSYVYDDEFFVSDLEAMLKTFKIDLSKAKSSSVDSVTNKNPKITLKNSSSDLFLSDTSYDFDGVRYFSAYFGQKRDFDFSLSLYSGTYWDEKYDNNFDLFKQDTLTDAASWYSIVSQGSMYVDGHNGFYYMLEGDDGWGGVYKNTVVYIEINSTEYLSLYYSDGEDTYDKNVVYVGKVLKNISFESGGKGKYLVPAIGTIVSKVSTLSDIKNYIYEANIKTLSQLKVFGEKAPEKFEPGKKVSRESFVVWAVKSLVGDQHADFEGFKASYEVCKEDCFADIDYASSNAMYISYAKKMGAISGAEKNGKRYFDAGGNVTLAAALKILAKLNGSEVWVAPEYISWYVPYLYFGYIKGIVPVGVNDAFYLLTRGEAAFMMDTLAISMSSSNIWF
ncbi:MAG: serine protease [Candidatus Peregrinibacteria bacterium]|nr:serine protease [Candidatus Peregrinibacteria bacterium]